MKKLLQIQKVILTLTDIREIRALVDSLYQQQTRLERFLALHFSVGDRVVFDSHGCLMPSIVTRVNSVTVQVSVDHFPNDENDPNFRLWKVPASKLRFIEKMSKKDFNPLEIPPPIFDESVTTDDRR